MVTEFLQTYWRLFTLSLTLDFLGLVEVSKLKLPWIATIIKRKKKKKKEKGVLGLDGID